MRILINDFSGHAFQIELSRELARRGHSVLHVYFADNLSTPKGNLEAGTDSASKLQIEGLHIPMKFSKHSLLTRRKSDIAYGKAAAAKVVEFQPEVVLSANMPLDAQKILMDAAKRQKSKFIFWLQDIYSFTVSFVLAKKLGSVAGKLGAWHYGRMERKLLLDSDAVVCIAPGFRQITTEWGVKPERLFVIENWAPLKEVLPTPKVNAWAQEHGIADKFCFMYSGTLGMKHRPELLLALAHGLESVEGARLLVIAAGPGADWLKERAGTVKNNVLTMLPFQPYNRISEVLGASDVLIALLDSDAGAYVAVPSKILSYLCAGRTLLLAAPPENHALKLVELSEAGTAISSDDPEEFVNAARSLMRDAALRERSAANGRSYAERTFNIATIADRFLDIF